MKQTKITKFAKGRACTMHSPMCNGNSETSVWCHSNMLIHGKGRSIKADEPFGFIGCSGCNFWYDDSKATREEKDAYFWPAFTRSLYILMQNDMVEVVK